MLFSCASGMASPAVPDLLDGTGLVWREDFSEAPRSSSAAKATRGGKAGKKLSGLVLLAAHRFSVAGEPGMPQESEILESRRASRDMDLRRRILALRPERISPSGQPRPRRARTMWARPRRHTAARGCGRLPGNVRGQAGAWSTTPAVESRPCPRIARGRGAARRAGARAAADDVAPDELAAVPDFIDASSPRPRMSRRPTRSAEPARERERSGGFRLDPRVGRPGTSAAGWMSVGGADSTSCATTVAIAVRDSEG
jgi:hypothetical protein